MSDPKPYFVTVVIPVHNEEAVLEANVRQIADGLAREDHFTWEVLLVENGSRDATPRLCQKLADEVPGVRWVTSAVANYGAAMRLGFAEARGDVIVNFDIDYWDLKFVSVAAHVMKARYDILIASKNLLLSQDRRGPLRKVASYVFRMILFFAFGLRVSDTHGIKAWRNTPEMRRYFELSAPSHHTYDTEVIIRAMHDRREVLEVPVEVVETRENDRNILYRVPQALRELAALHRRMRRP